MWRTFIKKNNLFYQDTLDEALRFGDVLKGYVATTPLIPSPYKSNEKDSGYEIRVSYPEFVVVLSPCCSIKDNLICLAPLTIIQTTLFKNPFFREDLTRLNRRNNPQDAYSPEDWERLSPKDKDEILIKGPSYSFLSFFVYDEHLIFPNYSIKIRGNEFDIRYYMIDFRTIYSLKCPKITSPEDAPRDTKCLQLSIQSRKELREKIVHFFGRTAQEDVEDD
jgi:hypothetical protein